MEIQLTPTYTLTYPELKFPDGITLVTGPSGVGKTTLLRALHGDLTTELAALVCGENGLNAPTTAMDQLHVLAGATFDDCG